MFSFEFTTSYFHITQHTIRNDWEDFSGLLNHLTAYLVTYCFF